MTTIALRRWIWVHKWSSLVCTAFMLLVCVTGLPLIFHHEIAHWVHADLEPRDMPADTPKASADKVLAAARAAQPGQAVQFFSADPDDERLWFVTLAPTPTSLDGQHNIMVDARTAAVIGQPKLDEGFMHVMLKLHVDLFADLPGTLFLGLMGLLLLAAIVSGVVLYAPFMRKLEFGTVRRERTARIKWLDLHNLLGIVTVVWALTVGATGVINTLAQPLFKLWQFTEVADMIAPYKNLPAPTALASLQASLTAAQAVAPAMNVFLVAFPGTDYSSAHHYTVFMRGNTPLTARLLKPVLVDAQTARVTDSRAMPWYMTALLVSQPLHFGDYGGVPLKIIWALLDIVTIVVLASGLCLWWKRHRQTVGELPGGPGQIGSFANVEAPAKTPTPFKKSSRISCTRWWAWPAAIAAASLTGLLSGLVTDGWGDVLAWCGLGLPLAMACLYATRGSRHSKVRAQAK